MQGRRGKVGGGEREREKSRRIRPRTYLNYVYFDAHHLFLGRLPHKIYCRVSGWKSSR